MKLGQKKWSVPSGEMKYVNALVPGETYKKLKVLMMLSDQDLKTIAGAAIVEYVAKNWKKSSL